MTVLEGVDIDEITFVGFSLMPPENQAGVGQPSR